MLNFQTGRRYWMIQYNQLWFETMWDTREDDVTKELWKKEFRVSVFIRSNWRKFTAPRHPFSESYQVEKRLAIVIWRLSTGEHVQVCQVFGVGKSTVIKIFQNGINPMVQLAPTFIKFPVTALETALATTSFQELTDCAIS